MAGLFVGKLGIAKQNPMLAAAPEPGENLLPLCLVSVVQRDCVKESSAPGCGDELAIVDDHFPS
jgi:hypothetical protein